MSPPGEVEFFVESESGASTPVAIDEDAVDLGQSEVPRWAVVLVALLVAVLVVGLASQSKNTPVAAPSALPSAAGASPTSTSGLGSPIPIDKVNASTDLAVSVPLFLLESSRLYKVTDTTAFGVDLDGSGLDRLGNSARLVLDSAAQRVWVVVIDSPDAAIIEFSSIDLHRLRTMRSKESIRDAAALRGHLYLARPSGLADVAPGATEPKLIRGLGGYIRSVTADPTRNRLLTLVQGTGSTVRQLSVDGALLNPQASVPVAGGNIRVTQDGSIWLGGFGSATEGAVIVRLDPKTLRPTLDSPVAGRLGVSGLIESAGDRDIWVRSGGNDEELWCVDGRTGSILQHWPGVRGAVTSRKGSAYVLNEGALIPLVMDGCTG